MANIEIQTDLDLTEPFLVEGLPGVGLVGKIATGHLINTFEMTYYAAVHCEGLPKVATYEQGRYEMHPPVRIYADETRDLLALQSDVPVSHHAAPEFATCLTGLFDRKSITPLCLSGLPGEKDDVPAMYGIGTGGGSALLEEHDVDPPTEGGLISGPTGALLSEMNKQSVAGVGLVVEANPQFPDPEAARILLIEGIEPIAGVDVNTDQLIEQAEEIAEAREQLAKQMQQVDEEKSTQAKPLGMYQ